jgi:hypothetical protein
MEKQLEKHPYGFEYSPLEDGRILVTELERLKYTKLKPIGFNGVERDLLDDDKTYNLRVEDFSQCIKDGGKFYQIDMFGYTETLTKEGLKQFIDEYYQY